MDGSWNPFAWSPWLFLLTYLFALSWVSVFRQLLASRVAAKLAVTRDHAPVLLDEYTLALMRGGREHVVATILARLVARGEVEVFSGPRFRRVEADPTDESNPYRDGPATKDYGEHDRGETALLEQFEGEQSYTLPELVDRFEAPLSRIAEVATSAGWFEPASGMMPAHLVLYTLWIAGTVEIGLHHTMRAHGSFVYFMGAVIVVSIIRHVRRDKGGILLPRGEWTLRRHRFKHTQLRSRVKSDPLAMTIDELAWAYALYGAGVFERAPELSRVALIGIPKS